MDYGKRLERLTAEIKEDSRYSPRNRLLLLKFIPSPVPWRPECTVR